MHHWHDTERGGRPHLCLTWLVQTWYDAEYLFTVEPHVFNPPPKVRSAVIRLTRNSRETLPCDEELFRRVVKTTFNQRRKTLRNNLKPLLAELALLVDVLDIDESVLALRPEQLGLQQFIDLATHIEAMHRDGRG